MKSEHLVIVDMQEEFMRSKPLKRVKSAVAVLRNVISDARSREVPVTYTIFPEEEYGQVLEELAPLSEEIVVKNDNDAFTSLEFCQRVYGSALLGIAGCNLEFCVRATVNSAVSRGYDVILYRNATLSRDEFSTRKTGTLLEFLLKPQVQYINFIGRKR